MGISEDKAALAARLDRTPFGTGFMTDVARKLKYPDSNIANKLITRGKRIGIFISHKEYCGQGIWVNSEGNYELCEVEDGSPHK